VTALFLGLNFQPGAPQALGTDEDILRTRFAWMNDDPLKLFGRIPTQRGARRIPQSSGKPILNRPPPWNDAANFAYIDNFGTLGAPNFLVDNGICNEAHELAFRIISARQRTRDPSTGQPTTKRDP